MKVISLYIFITALSWHGLASAQPAHAPAHGAHGARGHQEQQAGQGGREHRQEHRHEYRREHRSERYIDLPRINERELLGLLRQYEAPRAEPLPPGIQRQLERGKPLPPGIAKRFDGPIAQQLPRYPGYEWERVGADVVLIEAATRVVVDILVDALR